MVSKTKKILITSGPTWVAIDDVRVISNVSTGKMGEALVAACRKKHFDVTLLEGPVLNVNTRKDIRVIKFKFYDELLSLLKKELTKNYDVVIHAAAVSDYKLKKPFKTKLSSHLEHLKLDLVPTQKMIHLIKKINPRVFLVGFKLEPKLNVGVLRQKTQDLFKNAHCDLVVANSTNARHYCGYILHPSGKILAHPMSRAGLAHALVKLL